MTSPTVSVIITTLNRSASVVKAIHSVFSQTYSNYDLHVIDDGSSDNTSRVVKPLLDGHTNTSFWRHNKRRGLCAARNTGIAKSTGEYIAFLDDDDEFKPNSLKKRLDVIKELTEKEKENIGVVYSGCEVHIPDENRITYSLPKLEGNIAKAILTRGISTIPSSGIYSRKALAQIGGFDENLISSIDHDLWMSLAVNNFLAIAVNEPLTITYIRKQQKNMVTATRPRIIGVEQYLKKWTPTYCDWFDTDGAQKYIQKYRTQVLGGLFVKKSLDLYWQEACLLLKHVLWQNRFSMKEISRLIRMFFFSALRKILPAKIRTILKRS